VRVTLLIYDIEYHLTQDFGELTSPYDAYKMLIKTGKKFKLPMGKWQNMLHAPRF